MNFIPTRTFQGPRPGYIFTTKKPQGTGYYPDAHAHASDPDPPPDYGPPTPTALLARAEANLDPDLLADVADGKAVRKLVARLHKAFDHNTTLRGQHPDDPQAWMGSEIALDAEIKRAHVIASAPDLYFDFCEAQGPALIAKLLWHENGDVVADAAGWLVELTDADAVGDNRDDVRLLVAAFREAQGLTGLVGRLATLDESREEEAAAIAHILAGIDNMLDVAPVVGPELSTETEIIPWLLQRIGGGTFKTFSPNQGTASEVLATLLQQSDAARARVVPSAGAKAATTSPSPSPTPSPSPSGFDLLLSCLNRYKKVPLTAAENEEELEMVQNVYDCVCTLLMTWEGRKAFLDAEGLQLMLILLEHGKGGAVGALRAMDFALTPGGGSDTRARRSPPPPPLPRLHHHPSEHVWRVRCSWSIMGSNTCSRHSWGSSRRVSGTNMRVKARRRGRRGSSRDGRCRS